MQMEMTEMTEMEMEEHTGGAQSFSHLLRFRLKAMGVLHPSLLPKEQEQEQEQEDVVFEVRAGQDGDNDISTVLAHSRVLRRGAFFFREIFDEALARQKEETDARVQTLDDQGSNHPQDMKPEEEKDNSSKEDCDEEGKEAPLNLPQDMAYEAGITKESYAVSMTGDGALDGNWADPSLNPSTSQDTLEGKGTDYVRYNEAEKRFIVRKLRWSLQVLCAILEWVYTCEAHIFVDELPWVYQAAQRMGLASLAHRICQYPLVDYSRLAYSDPCYCTSLAHLSCLVALLDDAPKLARLERFCKARLEHPQACNFEVETALRVANRDDAFLEEGFHELGDGCRICLFSTSSLESRPLNYVTVTKAMPMELMKPSLDAMEHRRHSLKWAVTALNETAPDCCHAFLSYATESCLRNMIKNGETVKKLLTTNKEAFKLRMVTKFKIGPILLQALPKAIEGISLKEKRGAGYFIQGPSYCTSITVTGDPTKILTTINAIPNDMVGRCALKIRSPTRKTTRAIYSSCEAFGVDIQNQSIVLLKPLHNLGKVLEFLTQINRDAFVNLEIKRKIVELRKPTQPF